MIPSSIETFLDGHNPYVAWPGSNMCPKLLGSQTLHQLVEDIPNEELFQRRGKEIWLIDVLDDGTAINYCIEVDDNDSFYQYL